MKNAIRRESFIMYRSFYEAVVKMPKSEQADLFIAICEYALNKNMHKLEGVSEVVFDLMKPNIDANTQKYLNGLGGKKYGKLGGKPTTPKLTPRLTPRLPPSEPQANPKLTPNVDVDVDVNENVDVNGLSQITNLYNQTFQKQVTSTKGFEKNYGYWKDIHSLDKIKQAIVAGRADKFWRDKLTLTILFRRKNPRGEDVDLIEDLTGRDANQPIVKPEKKVFTADQVKRYDYSEGVNELVKATMEKLNAKKLSRGNAEAPSTGEN